MRTKNLMAIAATLLIAGCSQNEITEISPDGNPAVGFSVYNGVQTKGSAITAATDLKSGFGVFAYHTGTTAWTTASASATPNFMYNQKVTSTNGTTWTYTPVKYWPVNHEKVTFFAYAPHNETAVIGTGATITPSANTAVGTPKLTFAINPIATGNDATKMVDFMVAKNESSATQDRTYTTSASGVTFTFQHALSRLTFMGKPSVELAASAGTNGTTYVMVKSAKILTTGAKFYKEGIFDCGTATWTSKTAADAAYDITAVMALVDKKSIVSSAADQTSGKYDAVALTSNATPIPLFTTNQFLFLIPESIKTGSGTTTAGDVKIEFTYDIVTVDTEVSKGYTITHHTTTAGLPTGALKQGTAYKYTVQFGINEVKFLTPVIESWDPETTGSITA